MENKGGTKLANEIDAPQVTMITYYVNTVCTKDIHGKLGQL